MANGWTEVKKNNPCPICGTGDYCATHLAEDGYGLIYLCKRYRDSRVMMPGSDTLGVDGSFYLLVGESDKGYGVYRNANDVQLAESQGIKIWRKNYQAPKVPCNEPKKELIPVGINEVAPDYILDRFYRELIRMYPLNNEHTEYLKKESWSDELIKESCLASIPVEDWRRYYHNKCNFLSQHSRYRRSVTKEIIENVGMEPVGVPGFFIDTNKKTGEKFWTFNSRSGIAFPLFNQDGQIVRLRIRMDYLDAGVYYSRDENGIFFTCRDDKKKRYVSMKGVYVQEYDGSLHPEKDEKFRGKGKYRWMSSYSRQDNADEGTYTNKFENGTESGNICGIYCKNNDNFLIAIATEGEKKSIIGNRTLGMPHICIPGVNSFDKLFTSRVGKNILENLKIYGCQYIAVAFDSDKYTNQMVMDCERGFIKAIFDHGFKALLVTWDSSFKGEDDAIAAQATLNFIEVSSLEEYDKKWYKCTK